MPTTDFNNGTVVQADWLNDVDALTYGIGETTGSALVGYGSSTVADELDKLVLKNVETYRLVVDGDDWAPAISRALDATNHIVLPAGGVKRITSDITKTLTADTIIDFNGAELEFSGSGRLNFVSQIVATGRTLAANALRYARSVQLNSAASIQRGDLLVINTTITPAASWSDTKKDTVLVSSVSGAVVTLEEGLNFQYDTTDAGLTVSVYRPVKLSLIRPKLHLSATDADAAVYRMVNCEGLRDVDLVSPQCIGDFPFTRSTNIRRYGVQVFRCWGVSITDPVYEAMSYPVGIYGGTRNIQEARVKARYCHHSHADVGDWSSDYVLDGLQSSDGFQSINTHPCFRAHAKNFIVKNDTGLSNWRVCGGSLRDGYIQSSVDDTAELPQFQNLLPSAGYSYINADADFDADGVVFDCPNRSTRAAFSVRYGRRAAYSRIKGLAWVGLAPSELALWICGPGNEFGPTASPVIQDSLVLSTDRRIDVPYTRVLTLASASTLIVPIGASVVYVTGTTSILNISTDGYNGRSLTLVLEGAAVIGDGGNLRLASTWSGTSDDTITVVCRSGVWYETSRSVN
jgi:hypothetical protein